MNYRMQGEEQEQLLGQAETLKYLFTFANSMAIKCAVQLGVPDIINRQGRPLTVDEIAERFPSPAPDVQCLGRIMRLLVRNRIFGGQEQPNGETLYSLTPASKWLLTDSELSLIPLLMTATHPITMAPLHHYSSCILDGSSAFEKATGFGIFDFTGQSPEFNKLYNEAMASTSKITLQVLLSNYEAGFQGLTSLVDVGGGIGVALNQIVKSHPTIKAAINFDLPHVVDMAPQYQGVSHVGGDMFAQIPSADAIFIKSVLHDWGDDECVKILQNCRRAIPKNTGKVIIVDVVLLPGRDEDPFADSKLMLDMMMIAHGTNGKERTKGEWKKLLEMAGFPRYNFISIPTLESVIEAFPV